VTSAALSSKRFLVKGLRHFLLAVQFFTRIPITGALAQWVGYSPAMLRASSAHFPAIGWLMGGVAAAVACGTVLVLTHAGHSPLASGLVAAALSTVATVWLTGAFHEDGLADVADGLGGSYDRTRALDIMKDSRVGAFGALALVLIVAVKVALIASLAARAVQVSGLGWQWAVQLATCLLFAHVLSRFAPLCVIRALPHVGLGQLQIQTPGRSNQWGLVGRRFGVVYTCLWVRCMDIWCYRNCSRFAGRSGGAGVHGALVSAALTGLYRRLLGGHATGV
jgi:cobalamin synthase